MSADIITLTLNINQALVVPTSVEITQAVTDVLEIQQVEQQSVEIEQGKAFQMDL